MINFKNIDIKTFLNEYWQKKPLLIKQALPNFINPLTGDELAGLALEDDIESRLVFETPNIAPYWQLKNGPFIEEDFTKLPKTHWTLLVQGVDRVVPEVATLLDNFNFIPQWRVDDVMISYAVKHGSVGPHYDNYDVFLYQAEGIRKWSLTTQACNKNNYLTNQDLRIMAQFNIEEEYILEPGDMLYLPPQVGHHGISMSDDCMTYSFGFRSYSGQELWDSFSDYLSEQDIDTGLYKDPIWPLSSTSEIPKTAIKNAKKLMQEMLNNEANLQHWFGRFATRQDSRAELDMPEPLSDEESNLVDFINEVHKSSGLLRDSTCRIAYLKNDDLELYINGCTWNISKVAHDLVQYTANNRFLKLAVLLPFLQEENNQIFLYELWRLQWLQIQ